MPGVQFLQQQRQQFDRGRVHHVHVLDDHQHRLPLRHRLHHGRERFQEPALALVRRQIQLRITAFERKRQHGRDWRCMSRDIEPEFRQHRFQLLQLALRAVLALEV